MTKKYVSGSKVVLESGNNKYVADGKVVFETSSATGGATPPSVFKNANQLTK
jgi:hypothetical protein